MFVIAVDSQSKKETLFMVNRSIQRKSFWSNRTCDAFVYRLYNAAANKCKLLKFGNPRVIAVSQAVEISQKQSQIHDEQLGWDDHKELF
jgi:hypothetical protein